MKNNQRIVFAQFTIILLFANIPGSAWSQTPGVWETYGPIRSVRINHLLVDSSNPLVIYLGSNEQGLFSSSNGGVVWTQANPPLHNKEITALLEFDGGILVGTSSDGVFGSLDGQNWERANSPMHDKNVSNLLAVGDTVYAATFFDGVFFSADGGRNWGRSNPPLQDRSVRALVAQGGVLYAGTTRDGVFRSLDNGLNWMQANSPMDSQGVTTLITTAGGLLSGTAGSGVFTSSNGLDWTQANAPMNDKNIMAAVAVSETLLVGTSFNGVFRSFDGLNWTQANEPMTDKAVNALTAVDGAIYAGTGRSFNPANGLVEPEGVFTSSDGGVSWVQAAPPLDDLLITKFARSDQDLYVGTEDGVFRTALNQDNWFPTGRIDDNEIVNGLVVDEKFIVAFGRGVYRSTDGGTIWIQAEPPMDSELILAMIASGGTLYAGTVFSGVFRSTDALNWMQASPPMHDKVVNTIISPGDTLYCGTVFNGVFWSLDGLDWTQANAPINDKYVQTLLAVDGVLYAGTLESRDPELGFFRSYGVYQSKDGGSNWTQANEPMDDKQVQVLYSEGSTVYAGTAANGVLRSEDGLNWQPANPPLDNKRINAVIESTGVLYAGTDEDGVFRSADGGINWLQASSPLDEFKVRAMVATSGVLFAATASTGVFRSTDSGVNWTPLNAGFKLRNRDRDILSLTFSELLNRLYAVGDGVFFQTLDFDSPTAVSMNINSDAAYTGDADVSVFINGDGADSVMVSSNPEFHGSLWQEISPVITFRLDGEDGAKSVHGKLKDHSWNESEIISSSIILDTKAPRFESHNPPSAARIRRLVTISQTVDEANLQSVELFFRRPGEPFNQNLRVIFEDESAQIDSLFVTNRGLDYRIVASDLAGQSDTLRNGALDFFSLPIEIGPGELGSSAGLPSGTAGEAFRVVSVPFRVGDEPNVESVFGDLGKHGTNGDWLFWRYQGNGEWKEEEESTVRTGEGYFLIRRQGGTLTNEMPGVTMETTAGVLGDIPGWSLRGNDWTIIGNPYNVEIPLQLLKLANHGIGLGMQDPNFQVWAYDGRAQSNGWTNDNVSLEPWGGLAIFVVEADRVVFSNPDDPFRPARLPGSTGPQPSTLNEINGGNGEWMVQVEAEIPGFLDRVNYFGARKDARVEQDKYDWYEPPRLPGAVSVSFFHPDWPGPGSFASDVRPPAEEGFEWSIEILATGGSSVSLRFENLNSIPPEFDALLIDPETMILRDLRRQPQVSVRIPQNGGPKPLKILVGKSDFVALKSRGLHIVPSDFTLHQNYPNPFNPSTVIRYELPASGQVTLKVFDLLGREVMKLEDKRERDAGFYEAVADLSRFGSGVFFYQITVDGENRFVASRKMLLVK